MICPHGLGCVVDERACDPSLCTVAVWAHTLPQTPQAYFNKRTDLWTQIDKQLTPYLASSKNYNRVTEREHVQSILLAPDSILAADERGAEWYFRQENEWALAEVLEKITKVQGQFRGVLLRKKTMSPRKLGYGGLKA